MNSSFLQYFSADIVKQYPQKLIKISNHITLSSYFPLCIFGESFSGKSSALTAIASLPIKDKKKVLHIDLESTIEYSILNYISALTSIRKRDLENPNYNFKKVQEQINEYNNNLKIKIISFRPTTFDIIKIIQDQILSGWTPDLVVIDCFNLLKPSKAQKNYSDVICDLVDFCKGYGICLIFGSIIDKQGAIPNYYVATRFFITKREKSITKLFSNQEIAEVNLENNQIVFNKKE